MSETMETIEDIVAEMRDLAAHRDWHNHTNQSNRERMLDFADRIEVSNGELLKSIKFYQINSSKAREALKKVIDYYKRWMDDEDSRCAGDILLELYNYAEEALAAPPRNCDLYKSEPEAYQAYLTAMKNRTKKTYMYFEPWLFEKVR